MRIGFTIHDSVAIDFEKAFLLEKKIPAEIRRKFLIAKRAP